MSEKLVTKTLWAQGNDYVNLGKPNKLVNHKSTLNPHFRPAVYLHINFCYRIQAGKSLSSVRNWKWVLLALYTRKNSSVILMDFFFFFFLFFFSFISVCVRGFSCIVVIIDKVHKFSWQALRIFFLFPKSPRLAAATVGLTVLLNANFLLSIWCASLPHTIFSKAEKLVQQSLI